MTPLSQLQMLPSQSGSQCLFTWKICFSAGFSAFQSSNYCFGLCVHVFGCSLLSSGCSWCCLNFQAYLGGADLLSQVLTEWRFFTFSRYPWARWERNDGNLSEQMKMIVYLLERWKEPGLVLRILTKVRRIWINTDSRAMSLGFISVSDESSCSAVPPVPPLVWQIKKKLPRYFNKNHRVLPIF